MVKKGRKDKTVIIGTDSERYASNLFQMMKNPNGNRRPDLVSINGRYNPKLSIELKASKGGKGVMVEHQLYYAVTAGNDYHELFGEELPKAEEGLFEDDRSFTTNRANVAYYYAVLKRTDCLKSEDFNKPYSAIKITYGDITIVPGAYGFRSFAINLARRQSWTVAQSTEFLKEVIKRDVLKQNPDYETRRFDGSFQNLTQRDIISFFHNDPNITTPLGKQINSQLQKYPELQNLERVKIPGPNGTMLYVLAEPNHFELFDKQFRKTVESRIPVLESIAKERKREIKLLDKIKVYSPIVLFETGGLPEDLPGEIKLNLRRAEISRLERLTQWLAKGESQIGEDTAPF